MKEEKLLVKDSQKTFGDNLVTFIGEVPASVVCSHCENISSELLKDPRGHTYCRQCVNMLNIDGEIECSVDDSTHRISELTSCNEAYNEALELTALCPKQGCPFQQTLREVMRHYRNCTSAKCTLCGEGVPAKLMSVHVAEVCGSRPLSCPYCEMEVEAHKIEDHMEDCDLRPATCNYCNADFDTYVELRDTHMDVCPEKPVECPYQRLGCNYQASNKELEQHLRLPSHVTLFVDRILKLESQVQELRKDNNALKDRVRQAEDNQKTEEYLRTNMADAQEDLREKISELQTAAMQTQPEVDGRISELEVKSATFQEPLDRLLEEIAKLK